MSYLEGHRQRLRNRFNVSVLGALEYHHAAQVVLANNCPGGVARPSEEDLSVTRALTAVFDALSVPVGDGLIGAGPRAFSINEAGLLRANAGATK
ncbi:JAB domain-containing protein [Bradyrhizobium japonicum]|uniref:JAB domain-containing protein n=1 Tax=Bradyrhizobium japonicum TaxID=375 RepID=UPI001E57726D|nr:JAB domain-containing protein [Bradyrhizobium japonicum]MCD9893216.1 hypothetical protein [Bradyrhizobium japonicum]WRJ83846.1 JAB domain-containing protein [Bradyrhizobium japonicum]WRJ92828.1 JAB domain-containing protein [Bradyrhizobium japonicum]WRK46668.1 JAB domain-containing protein [Bradyrhizobium japonicum]